MRRTRRKDDATEVSVVLQLVQLVGALLVLSAFLAAQAGLTGTRSAAYLASNLVGSAVLAVVAAVGRDYGFLVLEGVWAAVSGAGVLSVLRLARRRPPVGSAATSPSRCPR